MKLNKMIAAITLCSVAGGAVAETKMSVEEKRGLLGGAAVGAVAGGPIGAGLVVIGGGMGIGRIGGSAVEAMARVTRRIRPLVMGTQPDGSPEVVHQVAMPFHWGSSGPNRGDVVNDLIPLSSEPNVSIHESKALLCAIVPGRRPADGELGAWLADRYPELGAQDG